MSVQSVPTRRVPSYRRHKHSGQGVVTLDGHDVYCGPWGDPASQVKYHRLIEKWLAGEPATGKEPDLAGDITCAELALRYLRWAESHYVKDGQPTSELANVKRALRGLRECYAALPAKEMSPLKFKTIRQKFIDDGLARTNCNRYAGIVVRVFRYAVEEELVPPDLAHGLEAVKPLQAGRCEAPDHPPIGPVSNEDVEATLPYLPEPYRTMVRVQNLLGCRPGELMTMTGGQIDRSGEIWVYRPAHFKTEHHAGKVRAIPVGPRAQALLRPLLDSAVPAMLVFRNSRGRKITRNLYGQAITRACRKAGIEPWAPNQLRHSAASRIADANGIEAASQVLGHSSIDMTQVYVERNLKSACAIAAKMG